MHKRKKLMGTGGALSNVKKLIKNDFVLMNGDTIFNIDLMDFIKSLKKGKIGSIALLLNKKI